MSHFKKNNICVFVNDHPNSQSGPNKSIKLLVQKVFKRKVNIFYKKKKISQFKTLKYLDKSKIIYINGIYSFSHFIIPFLYSFFKSSKLIIAPRGMLGKEAFIKSKYKKKFFLFFLKFIIKLKKINIIYHATSFKEKVDILRIMQCDHKQVIVILNLNNFNNKFIKNKKKKRNVNFFYFSNITSKKNLMLFIDAMSKANIDKKNFKLDIYGKIIDKNYFEKLNKFINSKNLNVNYLGEESNDNLSNIAKNYHFLAHSSHGENYGHTIVESLSMGIPAIITDNTPWSDYDSDFDGLVQPSMLPYQLSRSLIAFYNMNNSYYQILKKKSYNYFYRNIFSKENKNIQLYKKLFTIENN
jgi:glycosyltransferase involved in cell wall biosynthesis